MKIKCSLKMLSIGLLIFCCMIFVQINVVLADSVDNIETVVLKQGKKQEVYLLMNEKKRLILKNAKGRVKWKSLNKSVANVSSDGVLSGVYTGITTIVAKNKNKTYKYTVSVPTVSIEASYPEYEYSLTDGCDLDITSKIHVNYRNIAGSPKYTYRSSNENVLKIENNRVIMVGGGTATITIKLGKLQTSAKCIIKDERKLETGEKNLVIFNCDGQVGEKFKQKYNVTDRYIFISNKVVEARVQDESIASVIDLSQGESHSSIELYAKKIGQTKIMIQTEDRTFSIRLNVIPFRSDDNLDELYNGVFFGPFGIRYENSTIIYQGRIAETNEEVKTVLYKSVDEVKDFVDHYLRAGMNDYEKIAAIYRYFSDLRIKYGRSTKYCYSWYGMMVEHEAVCEGACEATAMLSRVAGLDVYRCSSASLNHS